MKNDRSIIDDEIIKQKMAEYMEMKITEYIDEYMDINSDHLKPSQLNEYEMKRPEIGDFINDERHQDQMKQTKCFKALITFHKIHAFQFTDDLLAQSNNLI